MRSKLGKNAQIGVSGLFGTKTHVLDFLDDIH